MVKGRSAPVPPKEEQRQRLLAALRATGFIDPVDGTVPIWYAGKLKGNPTGPVWVNARQMVDVILANLP